MSTNYFARIIPLKKTKEELKEYIDKDDFIMVEKMLKDNYGGDLYIDYNGVYHGNWIHIGKHSSGWKFLWNPNVWYFTDKCECLYDSLTVDAIKKFIFRDDVIIYDEYNKALDKTEFWNEVMKCSYEGYDYNTYFKENADSYNDYSSNYYKFFTNNMKRLTKYMNVNPDTYNYKYGDFYSDGLRFSIDNDFR